MHTKGKEVVFANCLAHGSAFGLVLGPAGQLPASFRSQGWSCWEGVWEGV